METLNDGGYYSLTYGALQVRDGKAYSEGGEIFEANIFEAVMPWRLSEFYADWTDERRAQAKREFDPPFSENRHKIWEKWKADMRGLRASAKAKLTEEELEACQYSDHFLSEA